LEESLSRSTQPSTPAAITDPEAEARLALSSGDHHRAIRGLMTAYGGAVFAYCRSMLDDESQADDVLQLVFIQAFAGLPRFEARSTFKTWLFGIARHRCLDELKSASRRSHRIAQWRSDPRMARPTPVDAVIDQHRASAEREKALDDCLSQLPADTRDLVLLRFRHDLSYDEIAAFIERPAGTLRVRLFRALTALRRCLEGKGILP
jgi:RNA polymerase sigma factor (sigma-70 family)